MADVPSEPSACFQIPLLPADNAPKWFKEYFAQRLKKNRTDNEAKGGEAQIAMGDDDVAMLYSMPSTYIAHFDGNRSYGNYSRDHALWHRALHESGVQFRYVTHRMLRRGDFDAKRYKILILPLAFAIGPEEAEAIRAFVREGGTLLADVRPGTYDGHCKPLESGILDDLFGIKRTGRQDASFLDRMRVGGIIDDQPIFMEWGNYRGKEVYPQMKVDPTVTITTGQAHGMAWRTPSISGVG